MTLCVPDELSFAAAQYVRYDTKLLTKLAWYWPTMIHGMVLHDVTYTASTAVQAPQPVRSFSSLHATQESTTRSRPFSPLQPRTAYGAVLRKHHFGLPLPVNISIRLCSLRLHYLQYLAHDTLQFYSGVGRSRNPFKFFFLFFKAIQAEASLRAHMTQATQAKVMGKLPLRSPVDAESCTRRDSLTCLSAPSAVLLLFPFGANGQISN